MPRILDSPPPLDALLRRLQVAAAFTRGQPGTQCGHGRLVVGLAVGGLNEGDELVQRPGLVSRLGVTDDRQLAYPFGINA